MTAIESVGEGLSVDDLAPRDMDEHASRPHQREAIPVEEPGGFRRPLAADHDKVARRQKPIEIRSAAKLAEPRRQRCSRLRIASGGDGTHTEGGAQSADFRL